MTHELISTTCVSAGEGFYVSPSMNGAEGARDASATNAAPDGMDQVIAWRIDTFRIAGDDVPISTTWPITINGSIDTTEFFILRPDGKIEYPDGSSPRNGRPFLHLVQGKTR
ncbi:hypothetical protein WBP06_23670 [Novosphingobium sp. BL-8H]|uniref:hypothetical protein n=1 Tax=Novosphingobium sp. BL-8H TaxID=3127640 RepID=UPI003757DCEB